MRKMNKKLLEYLKRSKNPRVRDIATLALKNNKSFYEAVIDYNAKFDPVTLIQEKTCIVNE